MKKKPDLVVWDEVNGYNARLIPYPTNIGAPKFELPNVSFVRIESVKVMLDTFNREREELVEKMEKLYEEYNDSIMVWSSKISFEPKIGRTYYLYDFDGEKTLSILSPEEWNKKSCFIGSFLLTWNKKWVKTS